MPTISTIEQHRIAVEKGLSLLLQSTDDKYHGLRKAARYAILGGGKRLRPVMTLAVTEALGGDIAAAIHPACAVELIHGYSMVHDDLPCMDDDDFRRGRSTLHKVVPEGIAMLTGDLLLTYAFEVLARAPGLSTEQRLQMVTTLATRSGMSGLIGGQYLDLTASSAGTEIEEVEAIHLGKTAALITAAIEFGGIISGADTATMTTLQRFGTSLGLAFQIADDIIDVTASEAKHGKAIGSDIANNKATYVTLLGIEAARERASAASNAALNTIDTLPGDLSIVKALAQQLVYREL
ncbi:Geranylgeranyl pyrophosphate synthase, chloroplastic [Chlamydiales bacterium SCGC AG-110-P3]|nr:Geranylgeranyl pyrophosphate synthase, chloroplastic [Chlamydiales bacterium SCGC AG-110-P3]